MRHQNGGGSWDEYCYCCGFPFYYRLHVEAEELSDDPTRGAALVKEASNRAKAVKAQLGWLQKSVGFDSKHGLIFALGMGSDAGIMAFEKKQPSGEAQKMLNKAGTDFSTGERVATLLQNDDGPRGVAIHTVCAQLLEKEIGRKLVASDEIIIRKIKKPDPKNYPKNCKTKYSAQFFEWPKAFLDKKFSFASPSSNRASFLKCNAKLIKALRGGKTMKNKGGNTKHTRKIDKKYLTRDSPPYPANEHCGETKEGNDGKIYISTPDKNGICKWKLKG